MLHCCYRKSENMAYKYPSGSRTIQLVPETTVCQLPVLQPLEEFAYITKKKNSVITLWTEWAVPSILLYQTFSGSFPKSKFKCVSRLF